MCRQKSSLVILHQETCINIYANNNNTIFIINPIDTAAVRHTEYRINGQSQATTGVELNRAATMQGTHAL